MWTAKDSIYLYSYIIIIIIIYNFMPLGVDSPSGLKEEIKSAGLTRGPAHNPDKTAARG